MSVVDGGVIRQLSVSQIESFDHSQRGGCQRKWWFERALDLRPDQHKSQAEGEAGHALLARYFLTGERPKGRALMGKAVTGAIAKGELPAPGPDLLVEERFDGQPKTDAAGQWLPLDVANTLTLAGVPLEGFIDLTFRRGDVPEVWDHKFSSDPDTYAKRSSELIETVQLPVYVLSQAPYWPDAKRWRIAHHNVSKRGVHSFIRSAVVTFDQVLERKADVEATIECMKVIAPVAINRQDDVPANLKSCDVWNGCPHQSICSAYRKGNTVILDPAEAAMFADLPAVDEAIPDAAPTPPVAAPEPGPAVPEPKARRMKMIDEPAAQIPDSAPAPLPVVAAPSAPSSTPCACGASITPENGSRLQSGEWVHIGCPLKAPPEVDPPPAPPKERKRKAAPPPEPLPPPVDAGPVITTTPPPAAPVVLPAPPPEPVTLLRAIGGSLGPGAAVALAQTLEGIAKLLRLVA